MEIIRKHLRGVGGWSDGFLQLYAFFVEHWPCPDQHLVTAHRPTGDSSVRIRAMCAACGAVRVLEITAAEDALLESLPGHGSRHCLQ